MSARPKKKLCWNCEGSVSLKAEECPYCGVSVIGLSSEIAQETPAPPYRLVGASQESPIPVSPYSEGEEEKGEEEIAEEFEAQPEQKDAHVTAAQDDSKRVVLILSLLLGGSVFFIFGFALLLFSDEGYLSLHWPSAHWYFYLLMAAPMLFFGFRKLNALSDP